MKILKTNILLIFFFAFFIAQAQYSINTINEVLLQEKVVELKKSEEVQNFTTRAKKVAVSQEKIDRIIYAKVLQDYRIAALKKYAKETGKSLLINITDPKFDKNSSIREYRRTISSILTMDQFQYIYKSLLDLQVEREVEQTLQVIQKDYFLKKTTDTKVIEKWIQQYTTKAVLAQQYHAYDKKLSLTKYQEVLTEATNKYNEVLKQLNVASVIPEAPVPPTVAELFVKKAQSVGINKPIAMRIIALSEEKKKRIKAIEKQNKSSAPHVYLLETSRNSKDAVRDQFSAQLTQMISLQQFKKLFGDQLQEDISISIEQRMTQIASVYPLNDTQYKDMHSLVSDYVNKDILLQHYYSFDKRLLKQKQKVGKFKFDAAYKKKIKTIVAQ